MTELDGTALVQWLPQQRWFAAKSQTLTDVEIVESAKLTPELELALVQARFAGGAHELYQLVLEGGRLALSDPARGRALLEAIASGRDLEGAHGRFSFRHVGNAVDLVQEPIRAMGAEQSNSSIVFGDRLVLKLFRRLEAGINPELELLRFLTTHEYENIAPLYGWYEYEGEALAGTLAVVQRFVPGATDGWKLALAEIPGHTDVFLERIGELGADTARLHSVLSSDSTDPAFSPEDSSTEMLGLLRATLDEEAEQLFAQLPDDPRLEPIRGLGEGVRELIAASPTAPGGKRIRIHGDYHLGQTLHSGEGWTLLDFEGEPARPLTVRRSKRSPLRDIASMLRSFSYAAWAVRLQLGLQTPVDFEARARRMFIDAYLANVEPTLLPGGTSQLENLLATFELEKALYELRYELDNRPDWVPIPVAGIERLVDSR